MYAVSPTPRGPTKIGVAANLKARVSAIQTGCYDKVHVGYFGAFYAPSRYGAKLGAGEAFATCEAVAHLLEQAAHSRLKKEEKHRRGEWFDIGPVEAGLMVEKIAREVGLKPMISNEFWAYLSVYGPTASGNKIRGSELRNFVKSLEYGAAAVEEYKSFVKETQVS